MSIYTVLNQVKNHEVVLPAIQRDFVWSTDKLITLLDWVMRGYPIWNRPKVGDVIRSGPERKNR
jgi:uncharacterized protein with ParB-like and HNH nuclease domain